MDDVIAEVVLACPAELLTETFEWFVDALGFRMEQIFPADAPRVAVVMGHGVRLRLEPPSDGVAPGGLRLVCRGDALASYAALDGRVAPNGTRVSIADGSGFALPDMQQPALIVEKMGGEAWGLGRAGMEYRDLIPGRCGGRFVGSHIKITEGGPVPDYVHSHNLRFQFVYCYKGWVRLAYEGQGAPFIMQEGDCVLQPPGIKHRVLESSAGLEVIEVACPAEHETTREHVLELPVEDDGSSPNPVLKEFGAVSLSDDGSAVAVLPQTFVWHQAAGAGWESEGWRSAGFETQDVGGIGAATQGLGHLTVVRPAAAETGQPFREWIAHDAEFQMCFVLHGSATLHTQLEGEVRLEEGDCVVVPAGLEHGWSECSGDLRLLDVVLPSVGGAEVAVTRTPAAAGDATAKL